MSRWLERDDVPRGDDYDARWQRMAEAGESVHGEADLICRYEPATVLDAGCGTGRVAIELARRGIDVVGTDLDPGMLDSAREKAPGLDWQLGDLVDVEIVDVDGTIRTFDVVAMPGNVMIFLAPGTETTVLANLARHMAPDGRLIAGFQIKAGGLDADAYDAAASAAGLELEDRWSTWDREPFGHGGDYQVSVHRRV